MRATQGGCDNSESLSAPQSWLLHRLIAPRRKRSWTDARSCRVYDGVTRDATIFIHWNAGRQPGMVATSIAGSSYRGTVHLS